VIARHNPTESVLSAVIVIGVFADGGRIGVDAILNCRKKNGLGARRETVDRKKANGPVVGPIKSGSGKTIKPNPGLHQETPEGTSKKD
jgi:hypothetical protein